MSEHEGFGVPLLEAMLMGVPVLAYRAAAVPDTLGDAGVQFDRKDIPELAELAQRLARDAALRRAVLAGQERRLAAFAAPVVEAALRGYLEAL
jgi:glycosyltransferase involved in cell wall biosynthesis